MKQLSLLLAPWLIGCVSPSDEKALNVIYILADDLGYGDVGCYGQSIIHTPTIDKMAAQGMLFTQHYAGCTVSAPSRCSLLTGLHTGHTQIRGNREIQPEGQTPMEKGTFTLGHLFQQSGYTTGLFGKWGLGHPGSESVPNKMGFHEFYGYNCQRKSHTFFPEYVWHNDTKIFYSENANNGRVIYSADSIHHHALQFIRDNQTKPFFALLTYTLPHAEVNVPHDSLYLQWENRFEETPWRQEGSSYFSSEKPRASFASMIQRLDRYVGEIMEELKRMGLDQQTMIVFTSDNGPHREGGADPDFFTSYGPLRGTKRDMYEGGIRVPMIVWAPSIIVGGSVSDHISAFWDVMPTFAELTNYTLPTVTDGISFLPTLTAKGKQKRHDYLYWEFHEMGGRIAIRKGDWKGIKLNYGINPQGPMELYDLSVDIHENNNLASQHPDIVRELETEMARARTHSELFNFGRQDSGQ